MFHCLSDCGFLSNSQGKASFSEPGMKRENASGWACDTGCCTQQSHGTHQFCCSSVLVTFLLLWPRQLIEEDWASWFQKVRVQHSERNITAGRQALHWSSREEPTSWSTNMRQTADWEWLSLWDLWHTFSKKATPPNPSQTVPPPGRSHSCSKGRDLAQWG